jgi:hypothetical protein
LINARRLADHPGSHTIDLYECKRETRQIRRCVLMDMQLQARLSWDVLFDNDETKEFDGEAYIEREIGKWGGRDLILLDPCAIWLSPHDQNRRDRYGRILDALVQRGSEAVSLILFWTWGSRHQAEAKNDMKNMLRPAVNCGYQELRNKLHGAGLAFVRIKWCWGQWIVVPGLSGEHLTELEHELQTHCRLVTTLWKDCGHEFSADRSSLQVEHHGPPEGWYCTCSGNKSSSPPSTVFHGPPTLCL